MLTRHVKRNFEVNIRYVAPGRALFDFNVMAIKTVLQIHERPASGNLLVFLPGQGEISQVCGVLRERAKDLDVFPLYSALPAGV